MIAIQNQRIFYFKEMKDLMYDKYSQVLNDLNYTPNVDIDIQVHWNKKFFGFE